MREERAGPVTRFVVAPVGRQVTAEGSPRARWRASCGADPGDQRLGLSDSIPEGTVLRGVTAQDGIATVDAVRFRLDGEPVELLSGEGLVEVSTEDGSEISVVTVPSG